MASKQTLIGMALASTLLGCREKAVEIPAEGTHVAQAPKAIELEEPAGVPEESPAAEVPAPEATAAAASPSAAAPSAPAAEVPFPLPILEGAKVLRRVDPVEGAGNETRQITFRTEKPIADAASFYEAELTRGGYKPNRTEPPRGGSVTLAGNREGLQAVVLVMTDPADKSTLISLTTSRHNKKAVSPHAKK
ncbi:MAG: hypothetical protein U1E65_28030 [Myxococcota bacterium]